MNDKLKEFLESNNTLELAEYLSRKLRDYKETVKDPNTTVSIPNLNVMIEVSDELVRRLDGK